MIYLNPGGVCPLCKEYDVDSVKKGLWAYDEICAVCIEKQAISENIDPWTLYKFDDANSMLNLELVALSAMANVLTKKINKTSLNQT